MSTKSKSIICEICNDFFMNSEELDEHLAQVHFICVWCSEKKDSFDSVLSLLKHIWVKHPTYSW